MFTKESNQNIRDLISGVLKRADAELLIISDTVNGFIDAVGVAELYFEDMNRYEKLCAENDDSLDRITSFHTYRMSMQYMRRVFYNALSRNRFVNKYNRKYKTHFDVVSAVKHQLEGTWNSSWIKMLEGYNSRRETQLSILDACTFDLFEAFVSSLERDCLEFDSVYRKKKNALTAARKEKMSREIDLIIGYAADKYLEQLKQSGFSESICNHS